MCVALWICMQHLNKAVREVYQSDKLLWWAYIVCVKRDPKKVHTYLIVFIVHLGLCIRSRFCLHICYCLWWSFFSVPGHVRYYQVWILHHTITLKQCISHFYTGKVELCIVFKRWCYPCILGISWSQTDTNNRARIYNYIMLKQKRFIC